MFRYKNLNRQQLRNAHNDFWKAFTSPKTKRILFKPDAEKMRLLQEKRDLKPPKYSKFETTKGPRFNKLDIQMLSKALYEQVFKNYASMKYEPDMIAACRKTLEKHNMVSKELEHFVDADVKIPPLEGENLEEHFQKIGEEQSKPYIDLIMRLLKGIPRKPSMWVYREGWTRYAPKEEPQEVPFPLEEDLIFDVEVCMSSGKAPTLATAVSSIAWYGWVSRSVIDASSKPVTSHNYHEDLLIPLESQKNSEYTLDEHMIKPKVVIGHNVSYDRARIKEQYWLQQTGTRFVDTMSLHVCISGLTSYQRAVLKSKKEDVEDEPWKEMGSLNSLTEVHNLYCGTQISKETRSLFVDGTLIDIQREFQSVMTYCADDVVATHEVLKKIFPMFMERFPHPVTFAGMLELGTAYLPVNPNWIRYIDDCEQTYEELDVEAKILLAKRADQACQLLHDDAYKKDIWMWDQDWSVKQYRSKKEIKKIKKHTVEVENKGLKEDEEDLDPLDFKFKYLEESYNPIAKPTLLPGYPNWYRKLCIKPFSTPDWTPGPHLISTSMQITPKLLNLTWEGYPLHYIRGLGWGLLVPFNIECEGKEIPLKELLIKCPLPSSKSESEKGYEPNIRQEVQDNLARKEFYSKVKQDKTGGIYKGTAIWCDTILEDSVFFFKLPHKNGPTHKVGNPLAKDFLNKFSENVLAGDTESAEQVLSIARKLSYWRNNRDRIKDQMVVWLDKDKLPEHLQSIGAIVPQVVVCGTLTRRAVEPTWMTASNAHKERIGSELRAMIQAPPGYKIVGADVDSQELWIASVIGDGSYAKMHGATPFGWMTLSGNKAEGTDMHSVTAKAIGISRDHAKVINYARIYGAGQNFAEQLLKQFNPSISASEARSKAQKMFTLTKGKRTYRLQPDYLPDLADVPYTKWQAFEMAKAHGKVLKDMFYKPRWVNGTESAMFNSLEYIAGDLSPVTPFLKCRLSRALEPQFIPDEKFLPTRVNWVVQSGAVDFLHLMLVSMRWILKNKARFCLSFHDEVRYIVPEEHKYQTALAMHITNLLTRAFCSIKLGIYDLPQSVAFFSSVEIDDVLRKEAKYDCATPSNPHGLEKGFGIPNGESLDIYEAVKKAGGNKEDWYLLKENNVKSNKA